MISRDRYPIERFEGLTKEKMKALVYFTYDEKKSPIVFSDKTDGKLILNIQFFKKVVKYLQLLEERQPMKLTQTGNLPRKFCRELIELGFVLRPSHIEFYREHPLSTELDATVIHTINILTDLSGLTWKKNKKLYATKRCSNLLQKNSWSKLYARLINGYVRKCNWAYFSFGPEAPFIQEASGYSIHLVQKYGCRIQDSRFYSDKFLRTFPDALREFHDSRFSTPKEDFEWYYYLRTFENFLGRFGMVIIGNKNDYKTHIRTIRKTELFDQLFKWR